MKKIFNLLFISSYCSIFSMTQQQIQQELESDSLYQYVLQYFQYSYLATEQCIKKGQCKDLADQSGNCINCQSGITIAFDCIKNKQCASANDKSSVCQACLANKNISTLIGAQCVNNGSCSSFLDRSQKCSQCMLNFIAPNCDLYTDTRMLLLPQHIKEIVANQCGSWFCFATDNKAQYLMFCNYAKNTVKNQLDSAFTNYLNSYINNENACMNTGQQVTATGTACINYIEKDIIPLYSAKYYNQDIFYWNTTTTISYGPISNQYCPMYTLSLAIDFNTFTKTFNDNFVKNVFPAVLDAANGTIKSNDYSTIIGGCKYNILQQEYILANPPA